MIVVKLDFKKAEFPIAVIFVGKISTSNTLLSKNAPQGIALPAWLVATDKLSSATFPTTVAADRSKILTFCSDVKSAWLIVPLTITFANGAPEAYSLPNLAFRIASKVFVASPAVAVPVSKFATTSSVIGVPLAQSDTTTLPTVAKSFPTVRL